MPDPAGSPAESPQQQNEHGILTRLHALARSGAGGLRTSQQWEAWLRRAGRFAPFGFTNTMLIWAQNSDAVLLHDYRGWQRLGRQVVRGERGIRLIVTGSERQEERAGTFFDLLQTEGKPVLLRPAGQAIAAAPWPGSREALTSLALRAGFRVVRADADTGIDWTGRIIRVRRAEDEIAALAHQIGHVLMHADTAGEPDCQGIRKVEADSAAFLITRRLGLDASGISFPYVSSWAGTDERSQPAEIVAATGQRITTAAAAAFACLDANTAAPGRMVTGPRPGQAKQPGRPAARAAGRLPRQAPPAGPVQGQLARMQQAALEFFADRESQSWVPGYLSGRGFPPVVQQRWPAGYAPDDWTALTGYLRALGYSDPLIEASGLARWSSRGTLIDTFRNRAMFPVRSPDGDVLGFIGRAHPEAGSDVPKYLNSRDTELYHKGRVLFGTSEGRDALRSGATPVIVEGPLDVMAVNFAAAGRYAGVAPCGTALTTDQVTSLGRVSDVELGVLAAFDSDQAGQQAAIRAYDLLRGVTARPFTVQFPSGQDPAGYLLQHGADALVEVLDTRARPLADLVIDDRIAKFGRHLEFIEGKFNALHAVAPLIVQLPDGDVARQVARVAERLGLTAAEVTNAVVTVVTERTGTAPPSRSGMPGRAPPQAAMDFPAHADPTGPAGASQSAREGCGEVSGNLTAQRTQIRRPGRT
jgi:DNA primase